ncbi:protein kinase domain-containing protein [Vibrio maritimus]
MAIESAPPLWVNTVVPEHRLERLPNTRILHTAERDIRIKFSDNVLDTALLQREALWLSRAETLGVETHRCLRFFKDGCRGVLTTSYIDGKSLSELIRVHPVVDHGSGRCSSIVGNLISQIEQLHRVGIVHGDIKPSNVVIADNSKVSLIDFSNARRLGENWSERGVSQSTQSFAYPREDKQASQLHDYYALLVTVSSLVGVSLKPTRHNFEIWSRSLIAEIQKLSFPNKLTEQIIQLVEVIGDDLNKHHPNVA